MKHGQLLARVRPAVIWLALFFGVNGFRFGASFVRALIVMRNRATVVGTIMERSPRKALVASYEVEGRRYTAADACGAECLGIEVFDRLRVGDSVKVEYSRAKPQYAALGSARRLFISDLKQIAFVGVFCVFAAAYFEFSFRKWLGKSGG